MPEEDIAILGDYISTVKSPLYPDSYYAPYNPDALIRKKGGNQAVADIYKTMKTDDAVKSALLVKKSMVVSSGWKIEPASEDDEDKQIAEEVEKNLRDGYNGNFDEAMMEVLTALEYGFSVSEKIYTIEKNKVLLKEIKSRPASSFEFHTDEFGNLPKESGLRQWVNRGALIPLPQWKFIIYTHNREVDNWYGDSDLRSAYRSYFSKDATIKFWNIYLERFSNPLVIARYGKNTSSDERTDLQSMVKNLSVKTSALLPEDSKIEFIETNKGSTDFSVAIDKHNSMIMRSILVPKHLGFDETDGGSYALGKVNLGVFEVIVNRIRQEIETCFNEQLIRQMVILNYPTKDVFPIFKFNPLTEENKNEKATRVIEAMKSGVVSTNLETENYLRGLLGLPEVDEVEEIEVPEPTTPEVVKEKPEENPESETAQEAEGQDDIPAEKQMKFFRKRNPTPYERKVDFAFIEKALKNDAEEAIPDLQDIIRKIRDDFTSQIVRKKICETQNIQAAKDLEFKYLRDYNLECEKVLRQAFDKGKASAKNTYQKAKKKIDMAKVAKTTGGLVKSKSIVWLKEQSRIMGANISNNLQNKAKQIVIQGVQNGDPVNDVVNRVDETFAKYVAQEFQEGYDFNGMALYTDINTSIAKAFAAGEDEYNLQNIEDGSLVAYQWSSVLDNATTEGCEELDGVIYEVNDPAWNNLHRPRHWNCRSTLIPIYVGEEYVADDDIGVYDEPNFYGWVTIGGNPVLLGEEGDGMDEESIKASAGRINKMAINPNEKGTGAVIRRCHECGVWKMADEGVETNWRKKDDMEKFVQVAKKYVDPSVRFATTDGIHSRQCWNKWMGKSVSFKNASKDTIDKTIKAIGATMPDFVYAKDDKSPIKEPHGLEFAPDWGRRFWMAVANSEYKRTPNRVACEQKAWGELKKLLLMLSDEGTTIIDGTDNKS